MIAWLALWLVLAWMLVGEPLYGHCSAQRMLAQLKQGDQRARLRLYGAWMLDLWLTAAVALVVGSGLWGWSMQRLGFDWPHGSGELPLSAIAQTIGAFLIGITLVWLLRPLLKKKRRRPKPAVPAAALQNHAGWQLLPRSEQER